MRSRVTERGTLWTVVRLALSALAIACATAAAGAIAAPAQAHHLGPLPQCEDGHDNDGDGRTDWPDDPGCYAGDDNDEYNSPPPPPDPPPPPPIEPPPPPPPLPQCENGIDDDGDGLVDWPNDPGCYEGPDNDEYNSPPPPPPAQCADFLDNDGDTRVDYPNDPGCTGYGDNDEWNPPSPPPPLPQCEDGIDNDGDGLVDWPSDPGCTEGPDNDEYNSPPHCSDGYDNDGDGKVDYPADPGCSSSSDNDEYNAPPPPPPPLPQCENGIDDDGDGLVDWPDDPGCTEGPDNDEYNSPPHCSDGYDNDGDGKTDYPADPGCTGPGDLDEYNAPPPACSDGADNDNDGKTDYPADPGCSSSTDNDEYNAPPPLPQCEDGIDNDGDGLVDWPSDPGCMEGPDNDEYNSPPHCSDTYDNDGDGKIDYPADPGCTSASDLSEVDPPACGDGIDNDGDGKVDWPSDPGCSNSTDNDEYNAPPPLPQCENGIDDDGDGLADWPDDPGCTEGPDDDEYNSPPQCFDTYDNDGDGAIDYPDDPGCTTPEDADEDDAAAPPAPPPGSVRRTSNSNVTVYTNNQGTWYIARRCIPRITGDPNGTGASVGPGYIYRVDYSGREIVTPSPPDHPHTGLGVFQADVYRPGPRTFRAVIGNLCRGETTPIPGSEGSGVVNTDNTEIARGTDTYTATGYLWSHYNVRLRDNVGTLFELQYRYRFYSNLVQVWVNVIQCPTGSCGQTRPYIKMPRFAMLASGPQVDYTRVACYTTGNRVVREANQLLNPRGGTSGNHCNPPSRDSVTVFGSTTINRKLKIVGRSYPSSFSVGGLGSQWEAASGSTPTQGLDRWAYMPEIDGRPRLSNSAFACPGYPGYTITDSWDPSARNWEMVGDDGTHQDYGDGNKGYRWPTKGVFLKGWEDGSNHDDCETLFNRFGPPGEKFATYMAIRAE